MFIIIIIIVVVVVVIIIIIIIFFLHGLGRLICSGNDALPSFPRASTISSSTRSVAEGVFRKSGVVHSFKMVDQVLFVFECHFSYSRGLQFFSYNFASYLG
jgi:flagellar basal body-associated protein FliL